MGQIPIVEDTTIMCYTDGLTDQVDMNGQPFSTEDITSAGREFREDVSAINHVLANRIMQYRNGQSFTDDITIMTTVRIFGRN